MFCQRCGYQNDPNANFCLGCGNPLSTPVPSRVLGLVRDKLFAWFCTLFAVGAGFTIIGGGGVPVFNVLLAIFLFIVLSKVKSGNVDVASMRRVSGTIYAFYITYYVLIGLLVLLGVLLGFCAVVLKDEMYTIGQDILGEFADVYAQAGITLTAESIVALFWIFAAAFMFIAPLMLVYNVFVIRKIHLFAKSVYKNLEDGTTPIVHAKLTKICMWIAGVVCALSTLSTISSMNIYAIGSVGCNAAAYIIIAVLLGRYFDENNVEVQTPPTYMQY